MGLDGMSNLKMWRIKNEKLGGQLKKHLEKHPSLNHFHLLMLALQSKISGHFRNTIYTRTVYQVSVVINKPDHASDKICEERVDHTTDLDRGAPSPREFSGPLKNNPVNRFNGQLVVVVGTNGGWNSLGPSDSAHHHDKQLLLSHSRSHASALFFGRKHWSRTW